MFRGDENKPNDPYTPGEEYTGDTNGDGKLTYFEAHPEWYGLRDEKRSDHILLKNYQGWTMGRTLWKSWMRSVLPERKSTQR